MHRASPADENISIDGVDHGTFACADCHVLIITDEHAKATSKNSAAGCGVCHDLPRDTFDKWEEGCVQGGCHAVSTPQEQHNEVDADHALSADESSSCETSGCHTGDRAALHQDASTIVDTVTREFCMVCHAEGVPAAATCEDCHTPLHSGIDHSPGRASCQLSGCHDQTIEDTHLGCNSCHFLPTPPPDNTDCLNCHTAPAHDTADAQHLGDATGSGSRWVSGCSGSPNYDGFCHNISNVMTLHANLHDGSDGCPTCHAEGVTPSTVCRSCHTKAASNGVHHDNNKYLKDPADAAAGSYSTSGPANGWDNNLLNYDCQFCHWTFFYGAKPVLPEQRSPYAGDFMWYAGLRTGAGGPPTDTLLTIPGPIAVTDSTVLDYMVNYQTRTGYNYGYSEVSTDGTTWVTVPGNITSADPVTARHLGNGIAGDSAGWVAATFDLSSYAGQTIQIRLRYKTTSNPPMFGYAVDDIEIRDASGVLFADGAETADGGLVTGGWLRAGTSPPLYYPDDPSN
jgi:hypothetical protein